MGVGCGSFLQKLGCKEFVVGPPLPFSDSYLSTGTYIVLYVHDENQEFR